MPTKVKKKNKHSQRFTALISQVEKEKIWDPASAIAEVKRLANAKFLETVDVSIRLGIDPRKGDQNVRGSMNMAHDLVRKGKRVAVLAKGDAAKDAEAAGAEVVGAEDLIAKIQQSFKDFDVVVAHDEMAPQIAKIGKILGSKTPNKRNGTVAANVGDAVRSIKDAKRVEYRADKGGVVCLPLGKVNYDDVKLIENFNAAMSAILKAKPSSAKGKYILSVSVSSSMGPGFHIDTVMATKAGGG